MKRNGSQSTIEKKTVEDRYYDVLGEMIAIRQGEIALKELAMDDEQQNEMSKKIDAHILMYDKENKALINRFFKKKKAKQAIHKTVPKVLQMAASFIAVITLASGVAFATSQTFRVRVMELLYTVEDEYTSLKMRENLDASFDVPIEWQGKNYPSHLPEGIEVKSVTSGAISCSVEYVKADTGEHYLYFMENGEGAEMNFDSENGKVSPVMIHSYPGVLSLKEGQSSVSWSNARNYFLLIVYDEDVELLLDIAKSVINIK